MYPRFVQRRIHEALTDTRVVLLCGPRQSGKTTLAQRVAGSAVPFITLDDGTVLDGAMADPVGFIRVLDRAVIDEVQRAPGSSWARNQVGESMNIELRDAIRDLLEHIENSYAICRREAVPLAFVVPGSSPVAALPRARNGSA